MEIETVKLLGITIENELKFDEHLSNVYLMLLALTRIRSLYFKKIRNFLRDFWKPSSNTAIFCEYFIVEIQIDA